jgi:hypothetical protein
MFVADFEMSRAIIGPLTGIIKEALTLSELDKGRDAEGLSNGAFSRKRDG